MAAGVCFSYRAEDGGPLLFGQLGQVRPDGTWSAQPLLPAETVAAALLPLHQYHDDMAALDSDIWLIPLLVADLETGLLAKVGTRSPIPTCQTAPSVRTKRTGKFVSQNKNTPRSVRSNLRCQKTAQRSPTQHNPRISRSLHMHDSDVSVQAAIYNELDSIRILEISSNHLPTA
jgi:hypothetical protein